MLNFCMVCVCVCTRRPHKDRKISICCIVGTLHCIVSIRNWPFYYFLNRNKSKKKAKCFLFIKVVKVTVRVGFRFGCSVHFIYGSQWPVHELALIPRLSVVTETTSCHGHLVRSTWPHETDFCHFCKNVACWDWYASNIEGQMCFGWHRSVSQSLLYVHRKCLNCARLPPYSRARFLTTVQYIHCDAGRLMWLNLWETKYVLPNASYSHLIVQAFSPAAWVDVYFVYHVRGLLTATIFLYFL